MKKFWAIALVVLTMVCMLGTTCTAASAETSATTNSSAVFSMQDQYSFEKIEEMTDSEAIKTYCKAVYYRISQYGFSGMYLTVDEYNYLIDNDFYVNDFDNQHIQKFDTRTGGLLNCYFPAIFEGTNGIELWYTDSNGVLRAIALEGKLTNNLTWNVFGDAHHMLESNETILTNCGYFETVYNSQTGEISVWEHGVKIREHIIPKNSIYAGFSSNEGFIFRSGSDVYAVRDYCCGTDIYEVRVIAHNVEFVITADYEADDPSEFSQPLFLMKDGTVKCYCTFYSEDGTPVDDEDNLIDIRFEGGFNI